MKHMKSHSFTLVELLVVGANVLVLASVAAPAVKMASNAAFDTGCTDNLKQIGVATAKYVNDHQNAYPVGIKSGKDTWFSCMKPYVESNLISKSKKYLDPVKSSSNDVEDNFGGIFRCPADQFRVEKASFKVAYALSYAMHSNVGSNLPNGVAKADEVKNPAEKVYRLDCTYTRKPNGFVNLSNMNRILGLNKKKNDQNGEVAFRHGNNETNALFLDGHTGALTEEICLQSAGKMLTHQK